MTAPMSRIGKPEPERYSGWAYAWITCMLAPVLGLCLGVGWRAFVWASGLG